MRPGRAPQRLGFSLIELMVVVAILTILTGMLLSAAQVARQAADRAICMNNLKQIGLAMHVYHDTKNGFPPRRGNGVSLPERGWGADLLPFIEQNELGNQYDLTKDYRSPGNVALTQNAQLKLHWCPASPPNRMVYLPASGSGANANPACVLPAGDYFTIHSFQVANKAAPKDTAIWDSLPAALRAYEANNSAAALNDSKVTPISDILDGTSNTILVTEQAGRPDYYILGVKQTASVATYTLTQNGTTYTITQSTVSNFNHWGPWTSFQCFASQAFQPNGITRDGPQVINANNSQGVYSFHPHGANAVFADGSVHFLRDTMSPLTLWSLVIIKDGTPIHPSQY